MAPTERVDVLAPFSLRDRVAIVTGGGGGLGQAIVHALASAGATVVATSRNEATAQWIADEVADAYGSQTFGLAVDVTVPASVDRMAADVVERFGRIDVLINNAGVTHRGPIREISAAQWDEVVHTNLRGAWLCCRACHPFMRDGGWGRIVNVSSMFSHAGLANRSPYIASKGGLTALTRALAVEFAGDGIHVNALCPGPFETPMADMSARVGMLSSIPLGRWGQPAELGPAVVFLASQASSYITGAMLAIDGGYTAQ